MAKNKTLRLAAVAGMAIGIAASYSAQAQDNAAGENPGEQCYAINASGSTRVVR